MRLTFAILAAALVAAAPLHSQSAGARLLAEAERAEDSDPERALALVRRALPTLADDSLRVRALAARCWSATGAEPDSLTMYADEGIAAATRLGDTKALASLRLCGGYAREVAGKKGEAMRAYDRGVADGARLREGRVSAVALLLRGQLRYERGEYGGAIRDLDAAYRGFAALRSTSQQRNALNAIANLYADPRVAQYDRALEYYRQVLAANEAAGSLPGVATAHFNIAGTLERMGRLEEALAQYRRGLAIDLRRGDLDEVAVDRRAVGIVLAKLGRPAEALPLFDQVSAHAARRGDAELAARTRLSRGVALRMLGRSRESLAELELAEAFYRGDGNQRFLAKIHEELALAHAGAGAWRQAFNARGEQMRVQAALDSAAAQEQNSRLRVQFDSDKTEADNRALLRENALRREALAAAGRVRRLQLLAIALSVVAIGALVLLAIRQVATARRLREAALTDELTRLPNRRHLYLLADVASRTARSRGTGFSVLALDVDHFKRINDRFGHDAGDRVLRRVADAARLALREGDHLGRTGGEEFVAVLPGAPVSAAAQVAERVRAAVEATSFADVAPDLRVTVSVGLAAWEPEDDGFHSICRRADESLYRAKAGGRNRVEVAAG